MASSFDEHSRFMVPRWRDSRALSRGELSTASKPRDLVQPDLFAKLRADWMAERSVEHASEYVGAAVVNGQLEEVRDAAEFILGKSPQQSIALRRLARRALGDAGADPVLEDNPASTAQAKIAKLKRRLREDPRNALAWTDLAREYIVRGQSKHALDAMDAALALAKANRFVLRAACALYVHSGEPDRAVSLLRRSPRTSSDPWLMAAEIAASRVAEQRPASLKAGKHLIAAGGAPPLHVTELAGALATEELGAGAGKSAKKLFTTALVDPTENTVAQAEWASSLLPGIPLEPRHLLVPQSYEANARNARALAQWRRAIDEVWRWLLDQPFATPPAVMGSYLAGVALGDYAEAIRIAEQGLIAHPGDPMLSNNLVVSLAVVGRTDEAVVKFNGIPPSSGDERLRATLRATAGLLQYRTGDLAGGQRSYEEALELLRAPGNELTRAVAALHFAREEVVAGGADARQRLIAAHELAKDRPEAEVQAFLTSVGKLAASHGIFI